MRFDADPVFARRTVAQVSPAASASDLTCFAGTAPSESNSFRKASASSLGLPPVLPISAARASLAVIVTGSRSQLLYGREWKGFWVF